MHKLGAFRLSPTHLRELGKIGLGTGVGGGVGAYLAPKGEKVKGGVLAALADLGIMGVERIPDLVRYLRRVKVATDTASLNRLRQSIQYLLSRPMGRDIVRLPIASALGASTGYAIGKHLGSEHPKQQAIIGALTPAIGLTGTLLASPLHQKLLRTLR